MKNACIANLKQIDGAVQQWALENDLSETNRYSLTDTNITRFLKQGVLPQCPAGGVYVAGTTVDGSPRCTFHGCEKTYEYFSELERAFGNAFLRFQLVLSGEAALYSVLIVYLANKSMRKTVGPENKIRLIASFVFLLAALSSHTWRLLMPEGYQGDFFFWLPMLVFSFFGELFALVASVYATDEASRSGLVLIGGIQVLLWAPAAYDWMGHWRF